MNYFLSWCRPLLVAFLFHAVTSLLPPSFHKNDFSTCNYAVAAERVSVHMSLCLSMTVFFCLKKFIYSESEHSSSRLSHGAHYIELL